MITTNLWWGSFMILCRTMLITIKQKFVSQNPGTGEDSTRRSLESPEGLDKRIIQDKMPRVPCGLDHYSIFNRLGVFGGDSWTRFKKAFNAHQETGIGLKSLFLPSLQLWAKLWASILRDSDTWHKTSWRSIQVGVGSSGHVEGQSETFPSSGSGLLCQLSTLL